MANAIATNDRKATLRDKRAQGIAAMGLVTREGDRFRIATPTLRGRKASYEVWRDDAGRVRCSCLEFEEQAAEDASFRCEHILAVKHALLAKSTEAVTRQQTAAEAPVSAAAEATFATPNTNTDASEEPLTPKAVKTAEPAARSEREEDETLASEALESDASANVRLLAPHTTEKEQEMSKKQNATAYAPETDEMSEALETGAQQGGASVVPLGFTNTLRALKNQVDPNLVKSREGWRDRQGNTHMVEYIEWHTVADILDRIAPTWSHAVRAIVPIGDMVAVTAAITIDGVTREGVGTGTADSEMGIKKAEHDALKRAAVKFGIARELYQRESEVIEKEGTAAPAQFPRDPLAKSMADLVTPKQLGMIRALAREAGIDAEEECQTVLRCKTEELSKRAASGFIDHLKGLGQEAAGPMRRAS